MQQKSTSRLHDNRASPHRSSPANRASPAHVIRPLSQPTWATLLKALWGIASMIARKWISNSPKVIETIPTEERATEIVINSGQGPVIKTLEISWNSTEDLFTVTASPVWPDFHTTGSETSYVKWQRYLILWVLYARTSLLQKFYFRSCGCEATIGMTKYKMK